MSVDKFPIRVKEYENEKLKTEVPDASYLWKSADIQRCEHYITKNKCISPRMSGQQFVNPIA